VANPPFFLPSESLFFAEYLVRFLGLDFGMKRVGAAVSDPRAMIASPLEVYERRDRAQDARHYQKVVRENEIERIVVGLPLSSAGHEGPSAVRAREWGEWLAGVTDRAVVFYDERFTTVEAEEALRSAGVRSARRDSKRDMLAAQILLQNYLDAGCPAIDPPGSSLD
jgi:putative Holliday junction resolvase